MSPSKSNKKGRRIVSRKSPVFLVTTIVSIKSSSTRQALILDSKNNVSNGDGILALLHVIVLVVIVVVNINTNTIMMILLIIILLQGTL
jgi:hypothetical protein